MEHWKKEKKIQLLGAKWSEKSGYDESVSGLEENEKLDGFVEENRRVFPSQKGENIGWQFARSIIGNLQV